MGRIRSKRPDSWPPRILEAVRAAIENEVLVPFENEDKAKAFKECINLVRRSFRDHQGDRYEEIDALRCIIVDSHKIMIERPHYTPDHIRFPYTVCISPALGFTPNLNAAVAIRKPDLPPETPPSDLAQYTRLERELETVMREEVGDDNEMAEFFRSRRKNDT